MMMHAVLIILTITTTFKDSIIAKKIQMGIKWCPTIRNSRLKSVSRNGHLLVATKSLRSALNVSRFLSRKPEKNSSYH